MGLVSPNAAAHWAPRGGEEDELPFAGLTVALAPFPSANREERDMLATVLRCGGANIATISAKGEVMPSTPAPDVAVVDAGVVPSAGGGAKDAADEAPGLAGRAASAVSVVQGEACVSPEFFKSWLSRPGSDLRQHVLHGELKGALALTYRKSVGAVGGAGAGGTAAKPSSETANAAKKKAPAEVKSKTPVNKRAAEQPAPLVSKRRRALTSRN